MKVYYAAENHHRIADESFKFHENPNHPDLKGKKVRSTGYIGPMDRVIMGTTAETPVTTPETKPEADVDDETPATPEVEAAPEEKEEAPAPKKATKRSVKKSTAKKPTAPKQETP